MSVDRDADDRAARGFARALIRHARQERPPAAAYHRARRALATGAVVGGAIGGASVVATTAAAAPKLTSFALSSAAIVKWSAMGVVAGAMTLGAIHQARSLSMPHLRAAATLAPSAAKTATRASVKSPLAPETSAAFPDTPSDDAPIPIADRAESSDAPALPAAPPGASRSRPRAAPLAVPNERPAAAKADDLAAELATLDQVRSLLLAHAPGRALSVVSRYRASWPNGRLKLEATVLQIEALVQGHDIDAATSLAREFLASYPRTPFARRVRALVGLDETHATDR